MSGERWDAAVTPAEVWEAGRIQGVIDAIKAHHPDISKGEFLSLIVTSPPTDENPFEGVGDAVGLLAAVEALLDDCDQVADTPEHPNMVKVWAVRQVLAYYGGEPHRFPAPAAPELLAGDARSCLSCDEPAVDSGEGRYCGTCCDYEGTCVNDHCLTCGSST